MIGVALIAGGNVSSGVREDRRNRWVLAVFAVLGLLDGWLPAYTDRIGFWTIDGDALRWAGVALFAAGGALRLWPAFVLGNRFSGLVAIQPGHTLPHSRRRDASAFRIRRAIRGVPRAHVAPHSAHLLTILTLPAA